MDTHLVNTGQQKLHEEGRKFASLIACVALFSVFINLLMLTAPLYMLQVYDHVLSSRSEATLVALTLLMTFLFILMGALDYVRSRILARIGSQFRSNLEPQLFSAVMAPQHRVRATPETADELRDLDAVVKLVSSPVVTAVFDAPWSILFLGAIAIFHPWLGILAVSGGGVLIAISVANQLVTRRSGSRAAQAQAASDQFANRLRADTEMVRALGMLAPATDRWLALRDRSNSEGLSTADKRGLFSVSSKTFRQFLQSAMLGLGAYLVLQGDISPGAMIASSILLGRALAPLDLTISQWPLAQQARVSWGRLARRLDTRTGDATQINLPAPTGDLEVENATVFASGTSEALLRRVTFRLLPGQAMGVIGPSGAGKSTLAKTLTGLIAPTAGTIRFGGATLNQYSVEALGRYVGYLPQNVTFFPGTIADNIAALAVEPDSELVIRAAKQAGAHDLILSLPYGYDTSVSEAANPLSGGQAQRIALARALYGDPPLLILDEPNSNLDHAGSCILNAAIKEAKQRGTAVLVMAHRPAAIKECDLLMVLDQGIVRGLGPREDVLDSHNPAAPTFQTQRSAGKVA